MDGEEEEGESGGGGPSIGLEQLRSYVAFARGALRKRRLWAFAILAVGIPLTLLVFRYLPPAYRCRTVLMGQGNLVLEGWGGPIPFAAAPTIIMSHDNLEAIVRETGLVKKADERQPPLRRLKDQIRSRFAAPLSDEVKASMLVGTLEYSIGIETDGSTLGISVDWTDGETAAEIAEAARDSYLRARRTAETSAFEEKMSILDGHASRLRDEVESLAAQIQEAREKKNAERSKAVADAKASARPPAASASATPAPAPVSPASPQPAVHKRSLPGIELKAMNERLDSLQKKLADLDAERERRSREERARMQELRLRLAASHPDVLTSEQRLRLLEQEPPEVTILRGEVKSLKAEIDQRELLAEGQSASPRGSGSGGGARASSSGVEPLPTEIVELLDQEETDPVMVTQLSGAIGKYGALRSEIRSARIELDTAQAAFNHRYKLVVPAEVPGSPYKPKAATVIGGGVLFTLLLALLLPILAELRSGVLLETWQVSQFRLPILAELKLPPRSSD